MFFIIMPYYRYTSLLKAFRVESTMSDPFPSHRSSTSTYLTHLSSPFTLLTRGSDWLILLMRRNPLPTDICACTDQDFFTNLYTFTLQFCGGQDFNANSWTKTAVYQGVIRSSSFPLLSAPHSLISIWTDLKRSEKIQVHQRGREESGFG